MWMVYVIRGRKFSKRKGGGAGTLLKPEYKIVREFTKQCMTWCVCFSCLWSNSHQTSAL